MRNVWNLRPAHIADQITKIELIHAKSSDFAAYEPRAVDFGTYRTYPPHTPSCPPHEVPLNELKGHSGALVFGGGEPFGRRQPPPTRSCPLPPHTYPYIGYVGVVGGGCRTSVLMPSDHAGASVRSDGPRVPPGTSREVHEEPLPA